MKAESKKWLVHDLPPIPGKHDPNDRLAPYRDKSPVKTTQHWQAEEALQELNDDT